jgi:transposase
MLRAEGEQRVVLVAGLPVHHYSVEDAVAEAYAMVLLVDTGYATQREVAVAFGRSERTVRRHQEQYADGGMTALAMRSGWRPGRRRVPSKRIRVIERLRVEGLSNREIARRLGLTENAIREQLGPPERPLLAPLLPVAGVAEPGPSAASAPDPKEASSRPAEVSPLIDPPHEASIEDPEPVAMCLDVDPADRIWDRMLAALGLLDDAAPLFANAKAVPAAGVLCALPLLVPSGIFHSAHKLYGEIGPAFYGLRTTLLTLLLMALWRIKRPEGLKEHDPQSLGRVLGLDRAPDAWSLLRARQQNLWVSHGGSGSSPSPWYRAISACS